MLTQQAAPSEADGSARPKPIKGRRARNPIAFSPPFRGLGSAALRRAGEQGGEAPAAPTASKLSVPGAAQAEVRDIVELTFGRREAPSAPKQPNATATSASNAADRSPVPDVTDSPWRKVCDLLITAADGTPHSGTAWFISPRTLVTAGHCIFVSNEGSPAHGMVSSILVMPARNGETSASQSPFGWVEVPQQNLRVHPRWSGNRDVGFDYGAIILPSSAPPLGQQVGFFGFGHFLDQDLSGSAPVLTGYPDDVPEGTQWFERNLIKQVTPTNIFYDIFTSRGQSGSPVFFRNNNRDIACAIHNVGAAPFNSGVRINPNVIAQLNAWKV